MLRIGEASVFLGRYLASLFQEQRSDSRNTAANQIEADMPIPREGALLFF